MGLSEGKGEGVSLIKIKDSEKGGFINNLGGGDTLRQALEVRVYLKGAFWRWRDEDCGEK